MQVNEEQHIGDEVEDRKTDRDDLARIEKGLDAADIPKEVWIGTDSTADRVSWLIIRNKLNQQNSRSRLRTMNALSDALRVAAPHVCSLLCPSTKRTGTEWTHVDECRAIRAALALVNKPDTNSANSIHPAHGQASKTEVQK